MAGVGTIHGDGIMDFMVMPGAGMVVLEDGIMDSVGAVASTVVVSVGITGDGIMVFMVTVGAMEVSMAMAGITTDTLI